MGGVGGGRVEGVGGWGGRRLGHTSKEVYRTQQGETKSAAFTPARFSVGRPVLHMCVRTPRGTLHADVETYNARNENEKRKRHAAATQQQQA